MEFITVRIILVGLFLYSATLAIEEWSWHRDSRLETLDKGKEEGTPSEDNSLYYAFVC